MEAKQIGASFIDELESHGGLLGNHFTWFPDGAIEFFDDTPQVVKEGVMKVYEAHDPTRISIETLRAQRDDLMASANDATQGMADAFIAGVLSQDDADFFKRMAVYKLALSNIDFSTNDISWPEAPHR